MHRKAIFLSLLLALSIVVNPVVQATPSNIVFDLKVYEASEKPFETDKKGFTSGEPVLPGEKPDNMYRVSTLYSADESSSPIQTDGSFRSLRATKAGNIKLHNGVSGAITGIKDRSVRIDAEYNDEWIRGMEKTVTETGNHITFSKRSLAVPIKGHLSSGEQLVSWAEYPGDENGGYKIVVVDLVELDA